MYKQEKITIVPLRSADEDIRTIDGPVDLGYGVRVERWHKELASSDLSVWDYDAGKHAQERIRSWDICLVHHYESDAGTDENDGRSVNLMAYVLAHLRLIRPHRDSVDDYVQLQYSRTQNRYEAFRCSRAATHPNRFLCDCEDLVFGISVADLRRLKPLMQWIVEFTRAWESYYPLWLFLHFFEQAYLPGNNLRTAHLFRVMALEALFCTEKSFGKKALTHRIPKLIGKGIDLYQPYTVDYFQLPELPLSLDLVGDIYTFRNKIAHSDSLPSSWLRTVVRGGLNYEITYLQQLLEAATSIGRLSWLRILKDGLQAVFSDKTKMQAYLG